MQPSRLTASRAPNGQQTVASSSSREHTFVGRYATVNNQPSQERDDSWIEVSSQPSDDTYSSADDILSDGLTLGSNRSPNIRQRRRKSKRNEILSGKQGTSKTYDYSADDLSEAELVEGSSGPGSSIGELPQHEDFESSSSAAGEDEESSEEGDIGDDDDEDTGTMLGVGYRNDTRVQHTRLPARQPTNSLYEFQRTLQSQPSRSFLRHRNSHSGTSSGRQPQHHYPETKTDHDEALMASLSTLLSCAAAARGLPKISQQGTSSPGGLSRVPALSSSRVQLDTLHLVPDQVIAEKAPTSAEPTASEGKASDTRAALATDHTTRSRRQRSASNSRDSSSKRSSTTSKKRSPSSNGKSRTRSSSPRSTWRTSKLTSTLSSTDASLLTLAFSAGAVIILSAISFSAGYVLGREIGKSEAEAALSVVGRTGSVVREAQRGGRGLVGGVSRVVSVTA